MSPLPRRPAVALVVGLIRAYRSWVSPWLPPACRFEPSCSRYAEQAIEREGVLRGGAKAAQRLLRCHPFHPGGLDPLDGKR